MQNIFFVYFFSTIRLLSVSPRQRSAILDITHRTQATYTLLHSPQRKGAYSTCIYALIWMKIAMGNIQNGATERRRIVEKNKYIFLFSLRTKSILVAS